MQIPNALLLLIALAVAGNVHGQCSEKPPSEAKPYIHRHKVFNFNGGPPTMQEDTLLLWKTEEGKECFALDTWGTNSHECGASGELVLIAPNRYKFGEDECTVELKRINESIQLSVGKSWRRLGEGGSCPQKFQCGMYGSIDSGKFVPR